MKEREQAVRWIEASVRVDVRQKDSSKNKRKDLYDTAAVRPAMIFSMVKI